MASNIPRRVIKYQCRLSTTRTSQVSQRSFSFLRSCCFILKLFCSCHTSSPLLLVPPTKRLLLSLHPIFKTVLLVLSLVKYISLSFSSLRSDRGKREEGGGGGGGGSTGNLTAEDPQTENTTRYTEAYTDEQTHSNAHCGLLKTCNSHKHLSTQTHTSTQLHIFVQRSI